MPAALGSLRIPAFGRLAASYLVNELGDWMGDVALAILVFRQTNSALATAALFIAAKFVPAFLAPALIARVDQLPTRRALPALYLGEALIFAVLAGLTGAFSLPVVLVLVLVDGALAIAARGVVRAASAAVLEPAGALRQGNAVLNFAYAGGAVGGGALAGYVAGTLGVGAALGIDAVGFAGSALLVATARPLPEGSAEHQPWRQRVREGLAYARGNATIRRLLAADAVAVVFFTMVVPIQIVYARVALHTGSLGFGALLTAWGAGAVVGSILFAALSSRSLIKLVVASATAIGVAYLGLAAAGTLLVACAWSVLGGVGNGVQVVGVTTLLQEAVPADYQARITGLLQSILTAMPGIGFLIGGIVTAAVSSRAAYVVAGAGVLALVATLGVAVLVRRAGRGGRARHAVGARTPEPRG